MTLVSFDSSDRLFAGKLSLYERIEQHNKHMTDDILVLLQKLNTYIRPSDIAMKV